MTDDPRSAGQAQRQTSMFQPHPIRNVCITAAGAYLPGEPVDNDHIENVLGLIDGKPSRLKRRILKANGIKTRYYALGDDGQTTELNEELAAKAVHAALANSELSLEDVEMLAAGTTQGDVPIPGFASMVHGRLGGPPMEILSAGGVCCSSMAALSSAYRAVATQQRKNAVVVGSELVSRSLKGTRFRRESNDPLEDGYLDGLRGSYRDFDADFLRWMLSDGAGCLVLEVKPHGEKPSLRVDWIELESYANEYETCMYTGIAHKDSPRAGNTWLDLATISEADKAELMRISESVNIASNSNRRCCRVSNEQRCCASAKEHEFVAQGAERPRGDLDNFQIRILCPSHTLRAFSSVLLMPLAVLLLARLLTRRQLQATRRVLGLAALQQVQTCKLAPAIHL